MIFVISLISTLFILLILFLLLEYRSRSRRALARRMRYYSGEMDTQEKPKESKPLTERLMDILRSGGKLLSNIRHARGLDFQMQKAECSLGSEKPGFGDRSRAARLYGVLTSSCWAAAA